METQEFVAMVAKLDVTGQLDDLLELVGERDMLTETLDEMIADRQKLSPEERASRDQRDGELLEAQARENKKVMNADYRHHDPEVREESRLAALNDNDVHYANLIHDNGGEAAVDDLQRRIEDCDAKIAKLVATVQPSPKRQ